MSALWPYAEYSLDVIESGDKSPHSKMRETKTQRKERAGQIIKLLKRAHPDAQAVHSAEESLIFALPKELRRDLKAAGRS